MRDFQANDRVIGSELRSALVDAPERATYVVSDTDPTSPTDLEVGCDAGTVVVDGSEVSVSAQTESVSDISGDVTETAYRYHTLSVDATGTLVVRSSGVGEFDANDPDAEPITQVTEPPHETGEVFIGTAFQVGAAVERVFDGRYFRGGLVPTGVITMWSGSINDIPDGWSLCDGTDGTPDLTDRFVVGAGGQYNVGDSGGEDEHTLTEGEMPSHIHEADVYRNNEDGTGQDDGTFGIGNDDQFAPTTAQTQNAGNGEPHENRPPYYALAYIMKI